MFCPNCKNQISDDSKCCSYCGAPQNTANASPYAPAGQRNTVNSKPSAPPVQPSFTAPPAPVKSSSNTTRNVIIGLVVLVALFIFGSLLSDSGSRSDDNSQPSTSTNGNYSSDTGNSTPNPAYEAIFEGTAIVRMDSPFFNMENASFAQKDADGTIYCWDYGYKDDVVLEIYESIYFPVSDFTDAEKTELEKIVKAEMAPYERVSCITIEYNMGASYYRVTAKYTGLDNTANCTELYNAGLISENSLISMSESERMRLAEGMVKK